MLELEELLLLLEVVHYLLERFLQDQDFLFQHLYLLLLLKSSGFVLVRCFLLDCDVTVLILLALVQLGLLPLVILEVVSLPHRLLSQLLVLVVDVPFNLLDVPLRVLLRLRFELLQRLLELGLHLSLHPCLLNFDVVFLFLDSLFKTGAILLPSH